MINWALTLSILLLVNSQLQIDDSEEEIVAERPTTISGSQ